MNNLLHGINKINPYLFFQETSSAGFNPTFTSSKKTETQIWYQKGNSRNTNHLQYRRREIQIYPTHEPLL